MYWHDLGSLVTMVRLRMVCFLLANFIKEPRTPKVSKATTVLGFLAIDNKKFGGGSMPRKLHRTGSNHAEQRRTVNIMDYVGVTRRLYGGLYLMHRLYWGHTADCIGVYRGRMENQIKATIQGS